VPAAQREALADKGQGALAKCMSLTCRDSLFLPPRSGALEAGSRRQSAVRVRLGEKEALDETQRFFEDRIDRWVMSRRGRVDGWMDGRTVFLLSW
jgi:hypothetical protein